MKDSEIQQKPSCSVVIRTLNEGRYLGQLLDSIAAQQGCGTVEVIVVDSGSTDHTIEIARKAGSKIVPISREEFSFGRSLNLGCEMAGQEFLVFVSGHCVPVDAFWLSQLLAPFSDPNVGMTYGRQTGGDGTKFSEQSLFRKYFPDSKQHGQAPFFCNNANSAVRASVWAELKFDESLTGLEDMEFAKRLHERGGKITYCPHAPVYHFHHERWKQVMRRYEREALALQRILPEVHVYWHDALRYFAAGVLGDFSRSLSEKVFFRNLGEIILFRACQYAGAWKGNHIHRKLSRREKERYFFPK